MRAERGRSRGRALKFFVSSSLSHCSAAESKKFPRQPDQNILSHAATLEPIESYLYFSYGPPVYLQTLAEQRRTNARGDWLAQRQGV
jgi:hypothetical protein